MQSEFENILLDTQKEYRRSNRMKDKIIVVLIVVALQGTENNGIYRRRVRNVRSNS